MIAQQAEHMPRMPEGKVRVLRGPADARALKERDTAKPPCELPDALGRQARVDAPKIRKRTCQRSIRPKLLEPISKLRMAVDHL